MAAAASQCLLLTHFVHSRRWTAERSYRKLRLLPSTLLTARAGNSVLAISETVGSEGRRKL